MLAWSGRSQSYVCVELIVYGFSSFFGEPVLVSLNSSLEINICFSSYFILEINNCFSSYFILEINNCLSSYFILEINNCFSSYFTTYPVLEINICFSSFFDPGLCSCREKF